MTIASQEANIRKAVKPEQLRQWMTFSNMRMWRDLSLAWAFIFGALVLAGHYQTLWAYLLAFPVIGFSQYALFILGHDGMHGSLHSNRRVNDSIARWLVYGPMFMGYDDGRKNHLEHHKLLGLKEDPDRYLHTLENKNSPFKFFMYCSGLATFVKTVIKVTPLSVLLAPKVVGPASATKTSSACSSQPCSGNRTGLLINFVKQRIPVMVAQPIIIAMIIGLGLPWWAYPILWIAPIYFCVFVPDEIRAFCDHAVPMVPDVVADDERLVTFTPAVAETLIFSPHNMNYHAEHHIWPGVPYYNRPHVHEFLKTREEVTVRKSYVSFLLGLWTTLPLDQQKSPSKEVLG